ncbi:hypothetical protein AcV5_002589 [Taiwanofungus camphoratus]|nr:hypothetical protein AcV5_002589 [Antrodia cinnamomea]
MTDQNSPGNPTRENTLQIKVWYCIDTINPMVITLGRMPAGVPVLDATVVYFMDVSGEPSFQNEAFMYTTTISSSLGPLRTILKLPWFTSWVNEYDYLPRDKHLQSGVSANEANNVPPTCNSRL